MATYLETHPQRVPQMNRVRRNGAKPSGVVVVHTAESPWRSGRGPVLRYFTTRTNYGSYHALADADGYEPCVPWSGEAFHDTATNNHSVGISAAVYAAEWAKIPQPQRDQIVKNMARAAADYAKWLKATRGISIPARRITRAQALNGTPGFIGHGETDPDRRSDPGQDFPWDVFFAEFTRLVGTTPNTQPATPNPTPKEKDMYVLRNKETGETGVVSGDLYVKLALPEDISAMEKAAGTPKANVTADTFRRITQQLKREG